MSTAMHDAASPPHGDAGTPASAPPDDATGRTRPELVIVALLAVAAGVVLRFVTRSALWLDEALSVNIATLPLGEITDALRRDGHPPLYYVLLHGWAELFGTGDLAVRSLSGVIGVLTLPLAFWYGRRRGGPAMGWMLLGVVALSPFALRYATETRMYALVILLVFAGAILLDDVLHRGRDGWGRLAGVALLTAALLYTHYWALWLLAAVGLLLLWRVWRDRRDPAAVASRRAAWRAIGALVVGGVLLLPWLPVMAYQAGHTGTPWAGPSRPTTVVSNTIGDFVAGMFADAGFVMIVLGAMALLGLFGRGTSPIGIALDLRTRPHFRREAVVAGVALGLGTLFTYVTVSAFATRYAAVVFPFWVVLVAAGLACFVGRWVRFGAFVAVLALLSLGAVWNVRDQRTQARQIGDAVAAEAQPGDLVVYCPDQLGPAGSRALPEGLDQVVYPTFAAPERVDWVDYAERNAAADPVAFAAEALRRAGDNAVFVIWNGAYETYDGQCEALVNAIASARPTVELVADGGSVFFEHATVSWAPRR